jgi:hypothetical protein
MRHSRRLFFVLARWGLPLVAMPLTGCIYWELGGGVEAPVSVRGSTGGHVVSGIGFFAELPGSKEMEDRKVRVAVGAVPDMGVLYTEEGCIKYVKIASIRVDVTALQFGKTGQLRLTGAATGGGFASFTPAGATKPQDSAATAWGFFLGPTIGTVYNSHSFSTSIGPYLGVVAGDGFRTTTTVGGQLRLNMALDFSDDIR